MKRPNSRLHLEQLETRDMPSVAIPYLSGPDLNLTVSSFHYSGPSSSQSV